MARLGPEKPRPMGTQHKTCLPGTRGSILREVRLWSRASDVDKRIFWLCDVGGSGKSTVALTMCEEWDSTNDFVLGRFFFSKNARKTSETDAFCSVVAEDIGSKSEAVTKQVKSAQAKDAQLLERGLRYQFTKLIEEPLQIANTDVVLVIDAVDECKKEMREELLKLLLEKLSSMTKLKLFITSRPEPDITAILQGRAIVRGMHFKMHGKEDRSNLEDISAYVNFHLFRLLTPLERQQLVERSNGLFIWITTAHLELKQADDPDAVDTILKSLLTRGEGGDINQVYTSIVRRLLRTKSLDVIRKVIGTILTLFEPVSTNTLAILTDIAHPELERIVASMQSVFRVEDVVEFLHPTFREYLQGAHNSDMRFDWTAVRSNLSGSVLNILQRDLKEDICSICRPDKPYPKNVDILDLEGRLQRVWTSSPGLSYSIRYWGYHSAPVVAKKDVFNALQRFLQMGILYLIELLSLMGQIHLIRNFEEVRKCFDPHTPEFELCRDAIRLVQRHQATLEESALHIYSSALLFVPRRTRLWRTYGEGFSHRLPKIIGPPSEDWPSYQSLLGHSENVTCVALSPDGLRIASGSDDYTLRLWDATTGASIGELEGHTDGVVCLAFSPDGLRIASASYDYTLRLWDTATGASIGELKGHTGGILCLAFSPDGLRIASGSMDHVLRLWDATTGTSVGELKGHTSGINCLAFSPDGTRIASGSDDHTLRLWDTMTGTNLRELKGHTNVIKCLEFSRDGLHIASGSEDCSLRLWDAITGASVGEPRGHTEPIMCLAFSPDGVRIASGSDDRTIRLWDATTGASIGELKGHAHIVTCVAFSPDGLRIASGSHDQTLRLWDAKTGVSIGEFKGHTGGIICLAFSPDGFRITSGSTDQTLRLWDATMGANAGKPEGHTRPVMCLTFSPDGLRIASGSYDCTIRIWDVPTLSSLGTPYTLVDWPWSLKFAHDGLSIQLENGEVVPLSQVDHQPPVTSTHPSTSHSQGDNVCFEGQELWSAACPQHIYKIPQEFECCIAGYKDKVALGTRNGEIIVIDFTDVASLYSSS